MHIMKVADFIRNKNKEGESQSAIARRCNISQSLVNKMIHQDFEPTLDTIKKIALAYRMSLSCFIDDIDEFNAKPIANIIARIKAEINKQGLDLDTLTEKAGLNRQRVDKLLSDEPKPFDIPTMSGLCRALGLPVEPSNPTPMQKGLTIKGESPPPLDRDLFTKALQGTARLTEGMELNEDAKIDMAGKLYDELYKVKYQKQDGE